LTPLDDELESLIQLILDLLAVLEIFLWVLRKVFLLLLGVFKVGAVLACPCLSEAGCDPNG
jgi:hypothetical protein